MHSNGKNKTLKTNSTISSKNLLNSIFNASYDFIIYSLDKKYCYMDFNNSHIKIMKNYFNANIKKGEYIFKYLTEDNITKTLKQNFQKTLKGKSFSTKEYIKNNDNKTLIIKSNYTPIYNNNGTIKGITVISIKESYTKRFKNKWINLAVKTSNEGIWDLNITTKRLKLNAEFYKILGYRPKDIQNNYNSLLNLLHPEEKNIIMKKIINNLKNDINKFKLELRLKSKKKEWLWILCKCKIIKSKNIHIIGCISNITNYKEIEKKLIVSEEKIQTLMKITDDYILTINKKLEIQYINKNLKNSIIGNNILKYISLEYHSEFIKKIKKVLKNNCEQSIEIKAKGIKGKNSWYFVRLNPVKYENSVVAVMLNATDITNKKTAEAEHKLLATAIEQAAESIIITDRHAKIQYTNPAFEKTTGYSLQEILGKNPKFLNSGKQDLDFYKTLWRTIKEGKTWSGHLINRKKDGTLYEEEGTISPIIDNNGIIINFVSVKRNVTDKIRLERQLYQAHKMQAVGTLAGGIAHDFNNILAAIIGFTELAISKISKKSKVYDNLSEVLIAGNRGKELIKQILTFSRQNQQEKTPLEISIIVKEAIKLLRSTIPASIEIRQEIKVDNSLIMSEPTRIHQILMNLCTNASYAMRKKGGTLEIILEDIELDQKDSLEYKEIGPGSYVRLTVSDTGHGMERRILDRIFEPFFTTKDIGEGTGMGLSVLHGIVKDHKGDIKVKSTQGTGSEFQIILPRLKEITTKKPKKTRSSYRGNEHILLVDDETALVKMSQEILEELGYKVTTKTNSLEALDTFHKNPKIFDIIITDQSMPFMNGDWLAREILNINPDIPIILCTGFSDSITPEKAKEIGIKKFIMKPIIIKDLAKIIRKIIKKNKGDSK